MISSKIYKFLFNKKKKLIKNKSSLKNVKRMIFTLGARKIDYIKVLDVNKLIKPFKKEKKYKIFIAYYLGSTRLIDNI
jgi:pantothenate synthetase